MFRINVRLIECFYLITGCWIRSVKGMTKLKKETIERGSDLSALLARHNARIIHGRRLSHIESTIYAFGRKALSRLGGAS